jgi:hypothetical protein
MISYSIEQKLDGIFNGWNLVATHDDGTKQVVVHYLTEGREGYLATA